MTSGGGFWILLTVTQLRGLISISRGLTHLWSTVFTTLCGWSKFR